MDFIEVIAMTKLARLLHLVKLWHLVMMAGVALFALGYTGGIPFTDIELRDGNGQRAICTGGALFLISIFIYYHPRD